MNRNYTNYFISCQCRCGLYISHFNRFLFEATLLITRTGRCLFYFIFGIYSTYRTRDLRNETVQTLFSTPIAFFKGVRVPMFILQEICPIQNSFTLVITMSIPINSFFRNQMRSCFSRLAKNYSFKLSIFLALSRFLGNLIYYPRHMKYIRRLISLACMRDEVQLLRTQFGSQNLVLSLNGFNYASTSGEFFIGLN